MAGLKKPIRLEKWVITQDGQLNNTETVSKLYNFWAEVIRESGGRSSLNGREALDDKMIFLVNFRPDWKPDGNWKVVYNGRRLTVRSIERKDEDRFEWKITADSR